MGINTALRADLDKEQALLANWQDSTIPVLGGVAIEVATLLKRNDGVARATDYAPIVARFSTTVTELEINGNRKRFDRSVGRIIGLLLVRDPECGYTRNELADDLMLMFDTTQPNARIQIGTATTALRYGGIGDVRGIVQVEDRLVSLRNDIVFLPLKQNTIHLAVDNTKAGSDNAATGRKKPPSQTKVAVKRHPRTEQYYAQWWSKYSPASTVVLNDDESEPAGLATRAPDFSGQGQLILKQLYGEQRNGQRFFDFDDVKNLNITPTGLLEPTTKNAKPILQPALNFDRDQSKVLTEPDVVMEIAKTYTYEYIIYGGEMPTVTDRATLDAIQQVFKEIGGYAWSETVSETFYKITGNYNLTNQMRQRIKQLGESLPSHEPKKTITTQSWNGVNGSAGWMQRAACRGTEPSLFFPAGTTGVSVEQTENAKSVCRICDVQADCLNYAVTARITDGIWGGTDEAERSRIIKR